jgi:hypothetical protein
MTDRISRKTFLRNGAGGVAGFAAGRMPAGADPHSAAAAPPSPWPYKPLNPEAVRKGAHDAYYEQGCGYAGFAGIIRELRAGIGEPFTFLPLEMMSYAGWGTVCGALNGACAAISLVCDAAMSGKIIDELSGPQGHIQFGESRPHCRLFGYVRLGNR